MNGGNLAVGLLSAIIVYLFVRELEVEKITVTDHIDVTQASLSGFDEIGIRTGYGN